MNDVQETLPPFAALGLEDELLRALEELGYEEPTPIQVAAIPALLSGKDVIGSAATGTGKTAAFALPIVQRIDSSVKGVQALVLAPTRELAVQVAEAMHRYGRLRSTTVLPIYGGQSIERQLSALRRGVQVVVGTPGRVLDHIRRRSLDLSTVRYVVLDEADEMLDMGFIEDIEAILGETPDDRQTALFSATFPPRSRGPPAEAGHPAGATGRVRGSSRAQAGSPGPSPRHRGAELRDHLLSDPHRGGRVDRIARLARLSSRSATRWAQSGTARPGHGALP